MSSKKTPETDDLGWTMLLSGIGSVILGILGAMFGASNGARRTGGGNEKEYLKTFDRDVDAFEGDRDR